MTRTSAGTGALYLNGVNITSGSNSGTPVAGGASELGRGLADFTIGPLDEMRFYNRILTQAEITQLYKLGQVKTKK